VTSRHYWGSSTTVYPCSSTIVQWTSESGTTEFSVYLSPAAGSLDVSVPELHSYLDGVHSTSSAQTSPSLRHSFHRLECLLQHADWSADSLAHHSCDFFRDVSFWDCHSSCVRGWDYRDCAIISCFDRSSHSWYFSDSGDRDCSYCCYYIFSSCTCSTHLDCFTATSIYRGSAWQFRVWGGYLSVCDHSVLLGTQLDSFCSPVGSLVLFLVFDAKEGERVDSGGVLIEGFIFFVCYFHASCLISRPAFCDKCACETLLYIMSLNWF
jgi:hypothetical protein